MSTGLTPATRTGLQPAAIMSNISHCLEVVRRNLETNQLEKVTPRHEPEIIGQILMPGAIDSARPGYVYVQNGLLACRKSAAGNRCSFICPFSIATADMSINE